MTVGRRGFAGRKRGRKKATDLLGKEIKKMPAGR
jgi:hypothetical protein